VGDHPSAEEFESFFRGSAFPDINKKIVRHLLATCSSCTSFLATIGWDGDRRERLVSLVTTDPEDSLAANEVESPYSYDEAFDRATRACFEEHRPSLPRPLHLLLDDLHDELAAADDLPVGVEDRVPDPKVIRSLIDRSHAVRHQDPKKMVYWARVASRLATDCDAAAAGSEAQLSDLRARALGQLGNALRVAGRLRDSERALAAAESNASTGTGEPTLRAELLGWKASLFTYRRRFGDAVALLDEATRLCEATQNRPLLASCLQRKAIALVFSGEPDQAIRILDRAIPLVDPGDKRVLYAAYHNLIYCYVEADRLQEALALFPQTRSLSEEIGDELLNLRLIWQEGRILNELGLLEDAEAQFSRARDGFLDRDLAYEAAVVSLDLTAVYVKLGLHAEVRRTIADILPIFSSLRVSRELLASLIQLQQAEDQTQALQLIRALSRELVAGPKLPPSV